MLDTIREYALARLAESGEEDAMRQAHAAYYLGVVAEANAQLRRPEGQVWLDRLEIEHDNLRTALGWTGVAEGDLAMGLRLAGALSHVQQDGQQGRP